MSQHLMTAVDDITDVRLTGGRASRQGRPEPGQRSSIAVKALRAHRRPLLITSLGITRTVPDLGAYFAPLRGGLTWIKDYRGERPVSFSVPYFGNLSSGSRAALAPTGDRGLCPSTPSSLTRRNSSASTR